MLTLDTFLAWYTQINKNKFASSFSPHKPLTILFTLTKALKGERWVEYASERDALEEFIWAYTNRPSRPNCLQPLWRLTNDSKEFPYWVATPTIPLNASGDVPTTEAREQHFKAGFSDELYAWLTANRALCQFLIDHIIQDNFPLTLMEDILTRLGLDQLVPEIAPATTTSLVTRVKRDPEFPKKVMQAYDYRCSVCGLKLYHQARPFPMEAAHIKWKARGGACEVQNGLSLCPTHHNTFDKGIWTLNMDYQVEISEAVQLDVAADVFFLPFKGKKVTQGLMDPKLAPNRENLAWHRENIFR